MNTPCNTRSHGPWLIRLAVLAASCIGSGAVHTCAFTVTQPPYLDGYVASAEAQPLYRKSDSRLSFHLWSTNSADRLQVRFMPASPQRFSRQQTIEQLNPAAAGVLIIQVKESNTTVRRVTEWTFIGDTLVATFDVPRAALQHLGSGVLNFGLDLPEAVRDIHPTGSVSTYGCERLMADLRAHPIVRLSERALRPQVADLGPELLRSTTPPPQPSDRTIFDRVLDWPVVALSVVIAFFFLLAGRRRKRESADNEGGYEYTLSSATIATENEGGEDKTDSEGVEDSEEKIADDADIGQLFEGAGRLGLPIAYFVNGRVYDSYPGLGSIPIGQYENGLIYEAGNVFSAYGTPVACYENGHIYSGSNSLGVAVGTCKDGDVFDGSSALGVPVANYVGDDDGAAAAAAVLLGLIDMDPPSPFEYGSGGR